jgi:sugar phosphate isomerase/epimerase
MQILFFRSTWGMELPSLEDRLLRIKKAGFDGVEMGAPENPKACAEARQLLDQLGLQLVVQQWTAGKSAAEHAASFEEQYERAVALKPLQVNSHTGRDYFSLEENLAVFDRATALEVTAGVPVVHETHRGRALFSTTATKALLQARPALKLTADFSHWCCVHESLLEDQQPAVERAIQRAYYIHARVGHSQGPQITDPRDPKWQPAMAAHLAWWQQIARHRREEGSQVLGICPEFGPPPYMVTVPQTGQPIADLWAVNSDMRDWLKHEGRLD